MSLSKLWVTTQLCISLIIAIAFPSALKAQSDSSRIFGFQDFMEVVQNNHPMAIQADLLIDVGEQSVRKARGNFDPKGIGDVSEKYFDGKQYYSLTEGGLKVPTWFGMEFGAGYMENGGEFLNPENSTPGAGLWQAGVTLPVGQGLFIDERRAELRKAQIFQKSTIAEQRIMYNELLYEAGKAYWDWFAAYNVLTVYEEALDLARIRLDAVKQGAELGDRPAIDTLEAGIQVQNRQLNYRQSLVDFKNQGLYLSIFLWDDGTIPLELSEDQVPNALDRIPVYPVDQTWTLQFDQLIDQHPLLQRYRFKLEELDIEQRWKREQLKPEVNLKYNALNEPVGDDITADYSINNYTWGIQFVMPLFLRKERASLKLNELKIRDTRLDLDNKQAGLKFKARAVINEWENTVNLIELYSQTVRDYLGLLEGERQMFDAGESSLFMVNSRELGYINAQLKLIELMTKNQKAVLQTQYAFGELFQNN